MASFGESWPEAAHLIGLIIEIVGVFFTAARFTKIPWKRIPGAFITALWQGEAATAAARVADGLVVERLPQMVQLLQGIAFILLGLAIQALGILGPLHKSSEVPDGTGSMPSVISNNFEPIKTQLETMGVTLSAIQNPVEAIKKRLDGAETTLSVIPKNVEAIKTQLETIGATLTVISKGIEEQMLDMRIAQPVNLSYLTGEDCHSVQQALTNLRFYKGKLDAKCDGATNAAAQEWQMQNRRTIAPAHSADQILKRLGTQPEQSMNTGR